MGTWKKAILEGDSTLVPSGGTTGQVLAKNSNTNYDTVWTTTSGTPSNSFETLAVAGQTSIVADSSTDTLTIAAGTGISLTTNATTDTLTITNTATGANAFGNVAVSGQTTVAADTTSDTLTIVAGTGISITTDATTDTLTITNSSPNTNSFANVSVSGQSTVAADAIADTLTLVAGTGISITTNATTDSVTITNSASVAGSAGQIQYNSGSAFAAEAALFYDATNNRLSVGGNNAPTAAIVGRGGGTGATKTLSLENSAGTERLSFLDQGQMSITEHGTLTSDNTATLLLTSSAVGDYRPMIAFSHTSATSSFSTYPGSYSTSVTAYIKTRNYTSGGLHVNGTQETGSPGGGIECLLLSGWHGATAPTAPSVVIWGGKNNGSGGNAAMAATESVFQIWNGAFPSLTQILTVLGSRSTGIGTTAPTSTTSLTVRGQGTSTNECFRVENSSGTARLTIRDDGGYAFAGGTVGLAQTGYTTFTNLTTDRTCDANATTIDELADILGTLIEDLKTKGIISA